MWQVEGQKNNFRKVGTPFIGAGTVIETQKVGEQLRTLAQKGPPPLPCMFVSGVAELGAVGVLLSTQYLANK